MLKTHEKSAETLKRMNQLNNQILFYKKSYESLNYHFMKEKEYESKPFAPRIIKFSRIPKSERRFQESLANINISIQILENELQALIKYGK